MNYQNKNAYWYRKIDQDGPNELELRRIITSCTMIPSQPMPHYTLITAQKKIQELEKESAQLVARVNFVNGKIEALKEILNDGENIHTEG